MHRTAPERRITLPPGVEDSVVQLGRLSPSLADLVEDAVGVEDQVALRWVRGGRERDRSRLATAVARWAPHVPVVLGPPQDLRLKLGPAFARAAVEVWRLARASKRAGTSPPPR